MYSPIGFPAETIVYIVQQDTFLRRTHACLSTLKTPVLSVCAEMNEIPASPWPHLSSWSQSEKGLPHIVLAITRILCCGSTATVSGQNKHGFSLPLAGITEPLFICTQIITCQKPSFPFCLAKENLLHLCQFDLFGKKKKKIKTNKQKNKSSILAFNHSDLMVTLI